MKKKVVVSSDKPEYEILHIDENKKLDFIIELYKQNKKHARVLFEQSPDSYYRGRVVIFTHANGDFNICKFYRKYGFNIKGTMYSREVLVDSLIYKKGLFYGRYDSGRSLFQLSYHQIKSFFNLAGGDRLLYETYLENKFKWMQFIRENNILHNVAYNTFIRYKLYNLNDALRHIFKVPLPVCKIIQEIGKKTHDYIKIKEDWKRIKPYLYNVENLTSELYSCAIFKDSVRMAKMLGYKINSAWSVKRLTSEHDKWAKEITQILDDNTPEISLSLKPIYLDFARYSGYQILKTNKELIYEGRRMHHCVASYIRKVNDGSCAIYHYKGYTIELEDMYGRDYKEMSIHIRQIQGIGNTRPPKELETEIMNMVSNFNDPNRIEKEEIHLKEQLKQVMPIRLKIDRDENDWEIFGNWENRRGIFNLNEEF